MGERANEGQSIIRGIIKQDVEPYLIILIIINIVAAALACTQFIYIYILIYI